MESEYSMFKAYLLAVFGPRFGLKKTFCNLKNELQREIIKFHNGYEIILTGNLIIVLILLLLWNDSIYFALFSICFTTFLLQIIFIYAFISGFDIESREQRRQIKEIEYEKKSEIKITEKIEKWKS